MNAALKISRSPNVPATPASRVSRQNSQIIEAVFREAPPIPANFLPLDKVLESLHLTDADRAAIREERIALGGRIAASRQAAPRLSDLRRRVGLSQAELAEAIGTSQSRLSQLEAGKQDATLKFLERMKDVLQVSWEELCEAALRCRK